MPLGRGLLHRRFDDAQVRLPDVHRLGTLRRHRGQRIPTLVEDDPLRRQRVDERIPFWMQLKFRQAGHRLLIRGKRRLVRAERVIAQIIPREGQFAQRRHIRRREVIHRDRADIGDRDRIAHRVTRLRHIRHRRLADQQLAGGYRHRCACTVVNVRPAGGVRIVVQVAGHAGHIRQRVRVGHVDRVVVGIRGIPTLAGAGVYCRQLAGRIAVDPAVRPIPGIRIQRDRAGRATQERVRHHHVHDIVFQIRVLDADGVRHRLANIRQRLGRQLGDQNVLADQIDHHFTLVVDFDAVGGDTGDRRQVDDRVAHRVLQEDRLAAFRHEAEGHRLAGEQLRRSARFAARTIAQCGQCRLELLLQRRGIGGATRHQEGVFKLDVLDVWRRRTASIGVIGNLEAVVNRLPLDRFWHAIAVKRHIVRQRVTRRMVKHRLGERHIRVLQVHRHRDRIADITILAIGDHDCALDGRRIDQRIRVGQLDRILDIGQRDRIIRSQRRRRFQRDQLPDQRVRQRDLLDRVGADIGDRVVVGDVGPGHRLLRVRRLGDLQRIRREDGDRELLVERHIRIGRIGILGSQDVLEFIRVAVDDFPR